MIRMIALLVTLIVTHTGCASVGGFTPANAWTVHNTTKHVLEAADTVLEPAFRMQTEKALAVRPFTEAAYRESMEPVETTLAVISTARDVTVAMHLAIDQWEHGIAGEGPTREVFACAGDALKLVADHVVQWPAGQALFAAAMVARGELERMADGAACPKAVKP